jgi:beta-lactam-binding protein with PASTA domain
MTKTDAITTLQNQGFTNITYYYACLGSSLIGRVIVQNPAPGTSWGKTQLVTIQLQANNC